MKAPKYKNKKTVIDGIEFDSKKEAIRWTQLKLMQAEGIINKLERQVPFVLEPSAIVGGRKKPAIKFVADFVYYIHTKKYVEDVKSPVTRKCPAYRLKRHLMVNRHGIDVIEV